MNELPAYVAIALLVIVTPGPDMALVMRNAVLHGRGGAMSTALGIAVGLLAWTGASVLGLAAILATSDLAFGLVRMAGAAYLMYLGLQSLLSLRRSAAVAGLAAATQHASPFRQGLLSNLLNPKIALLFTSLIPQFVTPGSTATLESVALAGIFIGLGLAWLIGVALLATALASHLEQLRVRRVLRALTGVVLVGLGARMAIVDR